MPSADKGGLVVKTDEHEEIFVDGWHVGSGSACVEVPPGTHHVWNGAAFHPSRLSFVSVGPGQSFLLLKVRDLSGVPPPVIEALRQDVCGQPDPESAATPRP